MFNDVKEPQWEKTLLRDKSFLANASPTLIF